MSKIIVPVSGYNTSVVMVTIQSYYSFHFVIISFHYWTKAKENWRDNMQCYAAGAPAALEYSATYLHDLHCRNMHVSCNHLCVLPSHHHHKFEKCSLFRLHGQATEAEMRLQGLHLYWPVFPKHRMTLQFISLINEWIKVAKNSKLVIKKRWEDWKIKTD